MLYGNISSSEDKIMVKTCGNLKHFLPEESSRKKLTKIEKTCHFIFRYNTGRISAKITQKQFDGMCCRKPSATVIPNCRYHCHNWRHS